MSTANKLTYLNVTKQELKQKINNLGGSIDDNTTFRNYANQLQNVYDNLPKTEYQEGTEINLGKTIKGKLDFENGVVGIGQSEQDGTPTPSTPIAIQCVTGNIEEIVGGKNLSTINSISTTGGGYINYSVSQLAEVTSGKTYTLSVKNNTSYTSNLNVRISSGGTYSTETQGNLVANGTKSYTFTASRSGVLNLNSKLGTEDITNALTEIQLEEGSTATDYEPYITPTSYQLSLGDIELCKIGNYRDYIYKNEGKWYKHSEIGKVVLNSISSKSGSTSNNLFISRVISDILPPPNNNSVVSVYANYFSSGRSVNNLYANNVLGIAVRQTKEIAVGMTLESSINTVALMNTWLETHNLVVYYPLETPTDTEITDTTLIEQLDNWYNAHSNNGTTIITSNGDLPLVLKVRGLKGE